MLGWWPQHQSSQAHPASNPTLNSPKTNHYTPQQNNHSRLFEEDEDNRWKPQTKGEHGSSPKDNLELFLALVWPKQLSSNPKPG